MDSHETLREQLGCLTDFLDRIFLGGITGAGKETAEEARALSGECRRFGLLQASDLLLSMSGILEAKTHTFRFDDRALLEQYCLLSECIEVMNGALDNESAGLRLDADGRYAAQTEEGK